MGLLLRARFGRISRGQGCVETRDRGRRRSGKSLGGPEMRAWAVAIGTMSALLLVIPAGPALARGTDDPAIDTLTDAVQQVISTVEDGITPGDPSPSETPSPSDEPSPSPSDDPSPSPSPSDEPSPSPSDSPSPSASPSPTRTTSPRPGGGGGGGSGGGTGGGQPQLATSTQGGSVADAVALAPVTSREGGTLTNRALTSASGTHGSSASTSADPATSTTPSLTPDAPADVASAPFRPFTEPGDRNVLVLGLIGLLAVGLVPFLVRKAREESNR